MSLWARVNRKLASATALCLAVAMPVGIASGTRLSDKGFDRFDVVSAFSLRPGLDGASDNPRLNWDDVTTRPTEVSLRRALSASASPIAPSSGWLGETPFPYGASRPSIGHSELRLRLPEPKEVETQAVLASTLRMSSSELVGGGEPQATGLQLALLRTSMATTSLPQNGDTTERRPTDEGTDTAPAEPNLFSMLEASDGDTFTPSPAYHGTGGSVSILADSSRQSANVAGTSLQVALQMAYANNPELNAARAQLQAAGEEVVQARSAMLPQVSANFGSDVTRSFGSSSGRYSSVVASIDASQSLFDGFQAINNTAAAKARTAAARQALKSLEQDILLRAATAYVNVLRDRMVLELRQRNLTFLNEQVRSTRTRLDIGEATITDMAQADSQQALAAALLNSAQADVASSEATYVQIIGVQPGKLGAAAIPVKLLPASEPAALSIAERENPLIAAKRYAAAAAASMVKSAEGARLPAVNLTASASKDYSSDHNSSTSLPGVDVQRRYGTEASLGVKVTLPLYAGGQLTSKVRQAKDLLGQSRIDVDTVRDRVRMSVTTAWAQFKAAQANVEGYRARVRSSQTALAGVLEEMTVGQRTTLDVLNAQAELIASQILLLSAERDAVVGSYALLAAMGRISI